MPAICECCEHPIQGPPAIDADGHDFCAPCIASLMGETVREARAEAEQLREALSAFVVATEPYVEEAAPHEDLNGLWARRFDKLMAARAAGVALTGDEPSARKEQSDG
jgi:hypothetical protein